MVKLLSHPFRLAPAGEVVCREDYTDEYLAERIGLVLMTIKGERVMVPEFGCGDLAYQGLLKHELVNQLAMWHTPAQVTDIDLKWQGESRANYRVNFDNQSI